jgi:hypothetical protein
MSLKFIMSRMGDERMDTNTHESESLPSEAVKPKRGGPTNAERALRFEKGLTQTKNNIKIQKPNQTQQIEFYALKPTIVANNLPLI